MKPNVEQIQNDDDDEDTDNEPEYEEELFVDYIGDIDCNMMEFVSLSSYSVNIGMNLAPTIRTKNRIFTGNDSSRWSIGEEIGNGIHWTI